MRKNKELKQIVKDYYFYFDSSHNWRIIISHMKGKKLMNEIVKQEKNELQKVATDILKIKMDENNSHQANQLIGNLIQCAQIDRGLQQIINPDMDYIVKIPNYIKEGLRTGKYVLLKKRETGEYLASVMQTKDGKKSILANLTLTERTVVDEKYIQNMSDGMFNMVLQQQYQQISYQLTEVLEVINRIEKNQLYEKTGAIKGAMRLLEDASRKRPEERAIDIGNARQTLYTTICTIQDILQERVEGFEPVPESKFMIHVKFYSGLKDYQEMKENEYNNIKTFLDYYVLGIRLLAYADYLEGHDEKIPEEFSKCATYLTGLDLSGIKSLENFYTRGRLSLEWFNRPQEYVDDIGKNFIKICHRDYDGIEIKLSGKELLEVLPND